MWARSQWLICLGLIAASCSTPATDSTTPPVGPVTSISQIEGPWDIVSFDGYRPQRHARPARDAYADFSRQRVSLRIECNYASRGGTVHGGRFVPADGEPGEQTLMGCGADREARERRYFEFFNRSPTIEGLPDGRLRLRADESELILERPPEAG